MKMPMNGWNGIDWGEAEAAAAAAATATAAAI